MSTEIVDKRPMKLSTKSEYAFLALLEMTRCWPGGTVPLSRMAARNKLSRKYLARILRSLEAAGLVTATRGAKGGFALAKAADQITMAEVVRALDGPIAPVRAASKYFYRPSPIEKEPALVRFFKEIRDMVARRMERTTLADLLRAERHEAWASKK